MRRQVVSEPELPNANADRAALGDWLRPADDLEPCADPRFPKVAIDSTGRVRVNEGVLLELPAGHGVAFVRQGVSTTAVQSAVHASPA